MKKEHKFYFLNTIQKIQFNFFLVIFLLLKCGEERDFIKRYSSQINSNSVNVIAIHDSPSCIQIDNYFNAVNVADPANKFLYKLVSEDTNRLYYANYLEPIKQGNLTSDIEVRLKRFLT